MQVNIFPGFDAHFTRNLQRHVAPNGNGDKLAIILTGAKFCEFS